VCLNIPPRVPQTDHRDFQLETPWSNGVEWAAVKIAVSRIPLTVDAVGFCGDVPPSRSEFRGEIWQRGSGHRLPRGRSADVTRAAHHYIVHPSSLSLRDGPSSFRRVHPALLDNEPAQCRLPRPPSRCAQSVDRRNIGGPPSIHHSSNGRKCTVNKHIQKS